jgi:hypothetical protein
MQNVKDIIYNLEHRYGRPISLVSRTVSAIDYTTGAKTGTTSTVNINRAIVLDLRIKELQLTTSAIPLPFRFGGEHPVFELLIVFRKEFGTAVVGAILVYDNREYTISEVWDYYGAAWLCKAKSSGTGEHTHELVQRIEGSQTGAGSV